MQNLTAAFRYTEKDTRLVGPDKQKVLTLWNTQTASTVTFKQTFCSENQEMTAPIISWALCCCSWSLLPSEAFVSEVQWL